MIFLIFMAAMTATVTTGLLPREKQIITIVSRPVAQKVIATSLPKKKIVKQNKKSVCRVWENR